MTNSLFCFGYGFSARTLSNQLPVADWQIAGTMRDPSQARTSRNTRLFKFDGGAFAGDLFEALRTTTHMLISVPPGPAGVATVDPVFDCLTGCLDRLGRSVAANLRWIGYLSTTGVYGDRGGHWVDETGSLQPTSHRAERRVAAEAAWLDLYPRYALPVHAFRLAGIYGPGRSAIDTVQAGRARRIVKPGQVFSRVHVDDMAAVLRASMAQPQPAAIYNVCDDEPAPPQDVVSYACRLLNQAPPQAESFETADLSDMARSFFADNKRVSNRRMKRRLGVALRYPNYRIGLRSIVAQSARTASHNS